MVKENVEIKKSKFNSFLTGNLSFSQEFETIESIRNDPPEYDIYITGSDQVWNPRYCHDDTTFLLDFVRNKARKIAFGASFGANNLSEDYRLLYRDLLKKYDYISVREESGVSIVKELVNRDAWTVLDPTLLVSAEDWNKEANQNNLYSKPYILCYLLGYSFDPFPYAYQVIKHLKRKLGLHAVFIGGDPINALERGNKVFTNVGPRDFLSLYRDAKFVVTTSFHGTAFSINYSKPFFTIINDEATLDDRQINLVEKLGANDRVIVKGQALGENLNLDMDYSKIRINLDMERSNSISFLKNALFEK